jgi:ABC-type thiamine transport system ATPase subunit
VQLENVPADSPQYCTLENVKKYGAHAITVSFRNLLEQLDKHFNVLEDFLVVSPCSGLGSFRPDDKDRHIHLAQKIDTFSHFIFGRDQDVPFFLQKEGYRKGFESKDKAVVLCSDAHTINDIGAKYSWIKADTSFAGLKQIVYEPSERVRIQEESPDFDFDKPVFESIQIDSKIDVLKDGLSKLSFDRNVIRLNRNLVSIIGGRGQGKSMLINYIGHGMGQEINPNLNDKINLDGNFRVDWKQGIESTTRTYILNEQQNVPFTFIYQSKLKEIAEDPNELKKEIMEMLKGVGFENTPLVVDEFKVKESLQHYWNLKEWLNRENEKGELVNVEENVRKRMVEIEKTIALTSEGSNRELLEKYIANIEFIEVHKNQMSKIRRLRGSMIESIGAINSQIAEFEGVISEINIMQQRSEIVRAYRNHVKEIYELEKENFLIKKEKFQEYKGDLSQLLSNLANYQREIFELSLKLDEIAKNKEELNKVKIRLNDFMINQKDWLNKEIRAVTETWKSKIFDNPERGVKENSLIRKILSGKNIVIEGQLIFDINKFLQTINTYIDGRVLRPKSTERIMDLLNLKIENFKEDFLDYTIEKFEKIHSENRTCFYGGLDNDVFRFFVDPSFRDTYLSVTPLIKVDGKLLSELSAGQRGTAYLCMKLATQLFSGPIIFDQPEDDLDNDFITKELIDLFKEIKKFRQVIIVSHNANLVVNSDSEQVIVAHNKKENLTYISGALEDERINKAICQILEGGNVAFERRRDKYNYKK